MLVLLAAVSCSTNPQEPLPGDVASYRYTTLHGKRFYLETAIPDTGVADTVVDSVYRYSTDSVFWTDTLGQVIDSAEIFWIHSYRAIRRFVDSSGVLIKLRDTLPVYRQIGLVDGRLYDDPSLTDAILVQPLTPGATWLPRGDSSVIATVTGEERLFLRTGTVRTYHVQIGALSDNWWAPDLGRVQYEEIGRSGGRVHGVLIGLGAL